MNYYSLAGNNIYIINKAYGKGETMPRISIAPMVDITDRHFRYFCRLLTKKSILYTEMITSSAIIHGDRNKILDFDPFEKPIVLQIAGCDKGEIAEAVKIAEDWDYDEINLNIACPSDRVSGNQMGAALMAYPELVAEIIQAMRKETKKPISVKHRIGINGTNILPSSLSKVIFDKYEDMEYFIKTLYKVGVKHFIIHARIAILEGLSPKENREVPPLRYDEVYRVKENFPELFIEINGGTKTIESIKEHLQYVDGVMLGRIAYENPFLLTEVDQFFEEGNVNNISRRQVIEGLIDYMEKIEKDEKVGYQVLKNTLGLFHNKRGSKIWRQLLSPPWGEGYYAKEILEKALLMLPEEVLNEKLV